MIRIVGGLLLALIVSTAHAENFDRHGTDGWTQAALELPREHHRERLHQHLRFIPKPTNYPERRIAARSRHETDGHTITAASGARTSVSTVAKPHFECLLHKLESAGYHVDFMGGYASRGNASAHPTGNALDINQTGRNRVTRHLPGNATEMAQDCGLVHGAIWSNPDAGHFEMPRKYGYVFHRYRTRYAARWQ